MCKSTGNQGSLQEALGPWGPGQVPSPCRHGAPSFVANQAVSLHPSCLARVIPQTPALGTAGTSALSSSFPFSFTSQKTKNDEGKENHYHSVWQLRLSGIRMKAWCSAHHDIPDVQKPAGQVDGTSEHDRMTGCSMSRKQPAHTYLQLPKVRNAVACVSKRCW